MAQHVESADSHWFWQLLHRWLAGHMSFDEAWMILSIAILVLVLGNIFMMDYPQLALWPVRIGVVIFIALSCWFFNLDQGFQYLGMRLLTSAAMAALATAILKLGIPLCYAIFGQGLSVHIRKILKTLRQRRDQRQHANEQARHLRMREQERRMELEAQSEPERIKDGAEVERKRREAEE